MILDGYWGRKVDRQTMSFLPGEICAMEWDGQTRDSNQMIVVPFNCTGRTIVVIIVVLSSPPDAKGRRQAECVLAGGRGVLVLRWIFSLLRASSIVIREWKLIDDDG
jgi:hypothetical protein